jgi:hypothetical protein
MLRSTPRQLRAAVKSLEKETETNIAEAVARQRKRCPAYASFVA